MHLLVAILALSVRSAVCQSNLTYVLSSVSSASYSRFVDFTLSNASTVKRLSSIGPELLNSTQELLSSANIHSIVLDWNTDDCTLPSAFALRFPSTLITSPLGCPDFVSPTSNLLHVTVKTSQLGSAASIFMSQNSLSYFSMLVGSSNELYRSLAQKFSIYLTGQNFILEKYSMLSNTSTAPSTSLRSKVFYVICSYDEEIKLYSTIVSSLQTSGSRIFVFLRWSHHFAAFYTRQYLQNVTLPSNSAAFAILHLLPVDVSFNGTLNDLVANYEQDILSNGSNMTFGDDLIFTLHELESVVYLRQLATPSFLSPVTLDSQQQRLFNFYLIGRQCNNTWTPLKMINLANASLTHTDASLNLCASIGYPSLDALTSDDAGWRTLRVVLFTLLGIVVACTGALIALFVIRSQRARKQMSKGPNKIVLLPDDLMFVVPKGSIFTSKVDLQNEPHERSNASIRSGDIQAGKTARYNGDLVAVKRLHIGPLSMRTKVMRELKQLKDLRHENVNTFIGLFIDPNEPALIFEYGMRGSLEDILKKEEIKLDWNFKWSMLNDLVRGMRYISNSPLRCHGNLKSRNCIVDSRWVLKITDYHLNETYSLQNAPRQVDIGDLLWMAPEHIRTAILKNDVATVMSSSPAGDVYSFGIIMQEVILRKPPFCMLELTTQEIIAKIKKPPPLLRPSVSKQVAPPEYINSMKQCWGEQPETRPSFNDLAQSIKLLNGGKKVNIVDTMFKMLEGYSNNLEGLIRERTTQLEEEKKKTDKLLSQMLPPSVAESLKSGKAVEAVWFECVTIYFSDIVGFTTISALSGPMEVVDLLNDLYTMFDSILEDFDCYKVETIGDAYMVVSGLPIENGINHAAEIATMALTLLHACGKFRIRHMPGVPLRLRIGLHSGACVAGVVGLKMPRYCLFGDTVNTASRMESTSMAFRIHSSETTACLLEEIGGFKLEFRGITEIKGRGNYKTFWLSGKDGFDKELPDPVISDASHGLDQELVKLVEKKAREEEAEKLKKAEQQQAKAKTALDAGPPPTSKSTNNIEIDDLLRITPPPGNEKVTRAPSAAKRVSIELPAKLQQNNEPVRKSSKVH